MSLVIKKEMNEEEIPTGEGKKIPRPMNAFMIYANENRKSMSLLFPKDSNKDISRRLGLSWKRLGREAKNAYFFKAQQMDLEHKRKYPNYVYNPKEARLRKAMRDANRERLIGCNSSMLQRPNARRATGPPHSWLQQGSHEPQMMMPIRCPSTAPSSALEPPPSQPPSSCYSEGGGAASPSPASTDQYMTMTGGSYHRRQHHPQRRPVPDLEAQGAAGGQPRNHDGYMQPNPLAQLQQQTDMWPGFQNDMRAPRSSPYLLQEPYHHHHHHPHQQAPSPMSMPSPILHHPHMSLTPPQAHHPVVLTPPHSNENVPPATEEGGADGAKEYEGKQQHLVEQTMQQPLMETNNLQQNQNQHQGYVNSYTPGANQYEKVQEEAQSKKAAPSACQLYARKPPRPKALPDFNEAFGSTERGRFQSPPDPNSAPNKRLMDFFFEDTGGGDRYSDSEFDKVSKGLYESEKASRRGDHAQECKTLLALAIEFCFENPDWFWLGERLIVTLINVAVEREALDRKYEAIGRFVYAKYLIENSREYDAAMEQLRVSRQLAIHRGWNLKEFLPDLKENLFSTVSYYTYLCYIREAQLAMPADAQKAAELADLARKRAAEICYREGETEGLMLKGECLLKLKNPQRAIVCFEKVLKLQERQMNDQGVCRALIALSKAYTMSGDALKALQTLGQIDTRAASDTLNYYRALAYKNMGEFYLDRGMPAKGNPLLHLSLDLFHQVALMTPPENLRAELASEIEQVQLLEALSTGLELYPYYIDLIINYDQKDEATGMLKLSKLVAWKDLRISFWDEETVRKDLSIRVLELKEVEKKQSIVLKKTKSTPISGIKIDQRVQKKITSLRDILQEASIILNSEDVTA